MTALAPRDEQEIIDVITAAVANGTPIDITGGGSRLGLGHATSAATRLSTSGLRGVTLYEPSELVLSAKAGTSLKEITDLLDQNGQELAFEPMDHGVLYGGDTNAGTIGGAISVNASGPRRIKVGAARDHLLGFRAANGRAEVFQSGGRVMKNVTGYDMCKLMSGAFGTLGVLSEITVKVMPKAETQQTLIIHGLDDVTAISVMTHASGLPHEVSSLAHMPVLARDFALPLSNGSSITALRVEGPEISVRQRLDGLKSNLAHLLDKSSTSVETLDQAATVALWACLRDVSMFAVQPYQIWRISTAPTEGPAIARGAEAGGIPIAGYFYDWAGGLIWMAVEPAADAHATALRSLVDAVGGHATLVRAADDVRAAVPVFHPQPGPLAGLSERIRKGFDPELVLNRGRMRGDL